MKKYFLMSFAFCFISSNAGMLMSMQNTTESLPDKVEIKLKPIGIQLKDIQDFVAMHKLETTTTICEACNHLIMHKTYFYENLEINIDDVFELGAFVTIKVISGDGNKKIIYDFLERKLYWDAIKECEDDYPTMIRTPEKNIGFMRYFLNFNTKK